jgi:glycosyltransferase involved in cell wall biosynthesis
MSAQRTKTDLPIRVAMLNRYDRKGGAAIAGYRLAEALRHAGADVRLFVRGKTTRDDWVIDVGGMPPKWDLLLEKVVVRIHERKREWNFGFGYMNRGVNFSTEPADVVHIHWPHHGLLSLEGLARLPDPVVWTLHDMWALTGGCHYVGQCEKYHVRCDACPQLRGKTGDLAARQWENKRRLFAGKRIVFVACSRWLAAEARRSALLQNADVRSIPNAIDTEIFCPGDKTAARRRWGLSPQAYVVLFASARIDDPRKGFAYLEKAIQGKKVVLAIMGESKTTPPPGALCLGKVSGEAALAEVYRAADVLAAPSLEDNLPNTVMEAAACGVPAVGFDVGGVSELIDDGRTGFVVPVRDDKALAAALDALAHPELRSRFSAAARQKVLDEFAYPVVARRYLELYRETLSRPPGAV